MKKLLAGLAAASLLAITSPASAAGNTSFHQANVTKDAPLVATVTTTAVGDLASNAYTWGSRATFTVTGPDGLSCAETTGDQVKPNGSGAACNFTAAPVGTYTFTVTPRSTAWDVWLFVSGEF